MSAIGVCTICGKNRDSRLCTCLDRRRNNDPIHPAFAEAERFIEETRYFGREAHEDALAIIQAERQEYYRVYADKDYSKFPDGSPKDGNVLKRIDRDAARLKVRADGKLYNTRQKMAEREQVKPKPDALSGANLKAFLLASGQ